ncbi:LysR family transcriptional regulator [Streptomyces cyaneofuscatus]|uniref:LysR family transcriptional regulator n=1 Tax=Streptomyces cyaneofuscatus TaxID=66883 RepID=UPI003664BD5E
MLDLSRLRALHAVSIHGSVAGAATALGYTPSAVSQQITKLERETRTTLLERRGRGVSLTEEALHLVDAAQQLLAIVERTETVLEERRGLPTGRLTIGAFASAGRGLLPGVLAELGRDHPALDVRLDEVDPHLSVDLVAKGVIDLAVAHNWDIAPLPAPDDLAQAVIGLNRCDLLVPAGHPLTGREAVRREELARERWICTGLGVAMIPRLGRGLLPAGVVAVRLDPVPERRLYALWRTEAARRPAITAAVSALRAHGAAAGLE